MARQLSTVIFNHDLQASVIRSRLARPGGVMAARRECYCDHLSHAKKITKVKHGDEFDLRKFNPAAFGYRPNAVPSEVLVSNPECCPIVHVKPPANGNVICLALYADGACADNGTPRARCDFI